MLFPVISILLLTAQCVAQESYTLVKTSISRTDMMNGVLTKLNAARKLVTEKADAADLYKLNWDLSLEWLARKHSKTCGEEKLEGLKELRLRVSDTATKKSVVESLEKDLKAFYEFINDNGADVDFSMIEFTKHYDFFRKEWKRIGCVFKICKDGFTGEETNLFCVLGPKMDAAQLENEEIFEVKPAEERCQTCQCSDSLCVEEMDALSDEEFKEKVLNEFNWARRTFAKLAGASATSKLVWNEGLAKSASDAGIQCPTTLTHGSNYRQLISDEYLNQAAGLSVLGEMHGTTAVEKMSEEAYSRSGIYTILWAGQTKVGCARTPSCPNAKVLCHFGDVGEMRGKIFEKGNVCSKCTSRCEDGLCVVPEPVPQATLKPEDETTEATATDPSSGQLPEGTTESPLDPITDAPEASSESPEPSTDSAPPSTEPPVTVTDDLSSGFSTDAGAPGATPGATPEETTASPVEPNTPAPEQETSSASSEPATDSITSSTELPEAVTDNVTSGFAIDASSPGLTADDATTSGPTSDETTESEAITAAPDTPA